MTGLVALRREEAVSMRPARWLFRDPSLYCYPLLMPKFLFWNLNRCDAPELIAQLAHAEQVEVFILAESGRNKARCWARRLSNW